jgi:hypothetical protein
MKILSRLYAWFQSLFSKHHFKRLKTVARISEIPDSIVGEAYIVERNEKHHWLVFDCPCGNGHRLTVNLSKEREPFWTIRIEENLLSVTPSVWLGDECHSHFWIKSSDIFYA